VKDIQTDGRVPILCGGTGFYFKVFLEGLGDAPPADAALRAELQATPLPDLLRELEAHDPAIFKKIDRKNPRRVIRAIEVIRLTGKPFSTQRTEWKHASHITHQCSHFFGLARASTDLRSRINARVDAMFQQGLVEETRRLLEGGLAENDTAMQSLGYRQVVEHLRGERLLAETIELVKIRTRQFAKRQMTWFRRQLNLQWIELKTEDLPATVAALVKARLND
jgi:tRNA dimethylallyltransferase